MRDQHHVNQSVCKMLIYDEKISQRLENKVMRMKPLNSVIP